MAEIVVKAIPDQQGDPALRLRASWLLGPRVYFGLVQWTPVEVDRRGLTLGVWYECLGGWDLPRRLGPY